MRRSFFYSKKTTIRFAARLLGRSEYLPYSLIVVCVIFDTVYLSISLNMLFIIFSFLFAIQGVGSVFEKRIKNGETIPIPDFGCTLCKNLI